MDILVLGAGRVGTEISRMLVKNDCGVTVIDTNSSRLLQLQSSYDLRTVQGNAADPGILKQAGVLDASVVVAVTAIDEVNLVACKICALLSENSIRIARIRGNQYNDPAITGETGFSIDHAFCPEQIVADTFSNAIAHPGCLSVHRFAGGRLALAGIRISSQAEIAGGTVAGVRDIVKEIDYRILSIYRDSEWITPAADARLYVGDDLYLLTATDNLNELAPFFAGPQDHNQRIFIVGGGNIGKRVAAAFENERDVKVMDINRDRCRVLSQQLSRSLVLKGSATDEELISQEGINETDIFCALTNDDEENILSAMLAKRLGARKVAALINRAAYVDILERQLDIVLSPSQITIGSVLAYIRPGNYGTIHSLRHGAAEAVEFIAHGSDETSQLVGREMRHIQWPPGAMPGAIIRGDDILIAHDDTTVQEEDHIICFVTDSKAGKSVEKLIQVNLKYL